MQSILDIRLDDPVSTERHQQLRDYVQTRLERAQSAEEKESLGHCLDHVARDSLTLLDTLVAAYVLNEGIMLRGLPDPPAPTPYNTPSPPEDTQPPPETPPKLCPAPDDIEVSPALLDALPDASLPPDSSLSQDDISTEPIDTALELESLINALDAGM